MRQYVRAKAALLAVSMAGVAACAASAGGGGGTFVSADAAGDSAATKADGNATTDTQAADDAVAMVDTLADIAEDAAPDVAPDVVKTPPKVNGEYLDTPLDAPPQFAKVKDTTGAYASEDALLGHYTVLWFYPAASTAG